MYTRKISGNQLYVYFHDQRKPAVGCGYYYTVTHGTGTAHTAFRTKRALRIWMQNSGLTIARRSGRSIVLQGNYVEASHMLNTLEFFAQYGKFKPFYKLDNGDYTIGFIEPTADGNILHYQNCNMDRPVLSHQGTESFLNRGTWRTY